VSFLGQLHDRDLFDAALAACRPHGVHVTELHRSAGKGAKAIGVARRAFLAHLASLGWSTPQMARLLGYRDHSSVLYLVQGDRRRSRAQPYVEALMRTGRVEVTP
jgi:hypothetical protein